MNLGPEWTLTISLPHKKKKLEIQMILIPVLKNNETLKTAAGIITPDSLEQNLFINYHFK